MVAKPDYRPSQICDWTCANERGDLCNETNVTPGKVWMRLRVDAGRVLLSNLDRWNLVLRREYVPNDEADRAEWDGRVRRSLRLDQHVPIPPADSTWPAPLV